MRPLWGVSSALALLLAALDAGPAQAAWCNVFQVCCFGCRPRASVSQYCAPSACCDPCCSPCPQQVCTTRYVQRCYYQPVTCYQTKSYYEPVTTYRTSYYYEPVTTYRYSCYFDPCTCCYQQVACPTTCYRMRSQCCPVQSWVQRCCQVPVTSYRVSNYWEPVTTCCAAPAPCCSTPAPCCPTSGSATCPQENCAAQPSAAPAQPGVSEQRLSPQPGVSESPERKNGSGSPLYDRYYPPSQNTPAPPAPAPGSGSSLYRPAPPRLPTPQPAPVPAAAPQAPPRVKLDRIVSVPNSSLQGQIVRNDRLPRPGARLMFVSTAAQEPERQAVADASGQFRVTLATGGWLVYVQGEEEKPVFHSKIDVKDNEVRQVILVSR